MPAGQSRPGRLLTDNRSYLKKVFEPNFLVGASFKILEILEYACGFKLGSAANLNQNPFFEMTSNQQSKHDPQLSHLFGHFCLFRSIHREIAP
jgi:hypothetical protein